MFISHKTAKAVNGTQIKFEGEVITNVTLQCKTKKLKIYELKITENLFGSDWMHEFNLWDLPISMFCRKAESCSSATENLISKLKEEFAEVFTPGLGKCTKIAAELNMKRLDSLNWVLLFCREAVGVFYSPSLQSGLLVVRDSFLYSLRKWGFILQWIRIWKWTHLIKYKIFFWKIKNAVRSNKFKFLKNYWNFFPANLNEWISKIILISVIQ